MPRNKITVITIFLSFLLMGGCYHSRTKFKNTKDNVAYNERQLDSISFLKTHHYARNYNFVVKADSIVLCRQMPYASSPVGNDTIVIRKHDNIVVVDTRTSDARADSVWIQVARDQFTFGWIQENRLLSGVVPDDPISQFISMF